MSENFLVSSQPMTDLPLDKAAAASKKRQPSGSEHHGVLPQVSHAANQATLQAATPALYPPHASSDPSAAHSHQSKPNFFSSRQGTLGPLGPLIGLPFSLMAALSLPHAAPSFSVKVPSKQALFSAEGPQQPPVKRWIERAPVHGVLTGTLYTPGAPKAPHGTQPSFEGHPLGEPSPREKEVSDLQIHQQLP